MAQEIELKLALPESAQAQFLRLPLLRTAVERKQTPLVNLYYDTAGLELRNRGIALRLRAQGKVWLQTVKCAGQAFGGLTSRPEWEVPYAGHFDFSAIDAPVVRNWLERPKLKARIAPIFETNFQRKAWIFEPVAGTRIEMVLDRGWIAAAGRRESISEIELELLHGDEAQLFKLARRLAEQIPLTPSPLSKADRGYRLFKQQPALPVKATPIPLKADDQPAAAFNHIVLACIDHLQRNHDGAINSDDPEYIHQMRVATRRVRAAMRLFGPLVPADFSATALTPMRKLMGILGQARDLDVLLSEIAEPVLAALPDEPRLAALVGIITERRFDRRREAVAFLKAPHFGAVAIDILAVLHHEIKLGDDRTAGTPDTPGRNLAGFAENRLRRLRRKVLNLAAAARTDDPASLHALRIGIKRLRYALEFFAPLASPKPMRRLLAQLAGLQDTLGQINDLANAGALLMECAGNDPRLREAVTLIGGWHGPRHQALLAAIPVGLKHLGRLRLPKLIDKD